MNNSSCQMSKSGILSNLDKGMESEKRCLDLCGDLLPLIDNAEDKEDIKKIMVDEARHIEITQKLIDIVKLDYNGAEE
ncbi:MAG: hypothetical protein ACOYL8_00215 [Patescibacteria group bacterium]